MSDKILIHARFAPNGTVVEISQRPSALTPQDWFNFLSLRKSLDYQALAGGRGIFRIAPEELEQLKAESATAA